MTVHLSPSSIGSAILIRLFLTTITCLFFVAPIQAGIENFFPGKPEIRVIPPSAYLAHNQNWAVSNGPNGTIAVANNSGLLIYNGSQWYLTPMPSQKTVRSLSTAGNQRVYVGLRGDFGYVDFSNRQEPQFQSLVSLIPPEDRQFTNVWDTWSIPGGACFLTDSRIFVYRDSVVHILKKPDAFLSMRPVAGELVVQVKDQGLMILSDTSLVPMPGGVQYKSDLLYTLFETDGSWWVAGDRRTGLSWNSASERIPFPTETNEWILKNSLYCGIQLDDESMAFGSSKAGLIITDKKGVIRSSFDILSGLPDNSIRSLYQDPEGVLWVATNNGLATINIGQEVLRIAGSDGLSGSVKDVVQTPDGWMAATSQGVFTINRFRMTAEKTQEINQVPQLDMQSWDLQTVSSGVLAATYNGVWLISGKAVRRLFPGTTYSLFRSRTNPDWIFAGQDNRVIIFKDSAGFPLIHEIKTNQEVIWMDEETATRFWAGTNATEIYQLQFNPGSDPQIQVFDSTNGVPAGWSHPFNIYGRLTFGTRQGFYRFDERKSAFHPDSVLERNFPRTGKDLFRVTFLGDSVLYARAGNKIYRRFPSGYWEHDKVGGIPLFQVYYMEVTPEYLYVGGTNGLYRISRKKRQPAELVAYIRTVHFGADSLYYQGPFLRSEDVPLVPVDYKSIRFFFSGNSYTRETDNQFRHVLEGFEEDWSAWTADTQKEYTNLNPGAYTFRVQMLSPNGTISDAESFSFQVETPFFLRWYTLLVLGLLLAVVSYLIIIRVMQSVRERNRQLENLVLERTETLKQKNKELEKLNEIIQAINSEVHFDDLLQTILEHLTVIPGVSKSSILVYNETSGCFEFRAARGWELEDLRTVTLTESEARSRYQMYGVEIFEDIFSFQNLQQLPLNDRFHGLEIPKSLLVLKIAIHQFTAAYIILDNMEDPEAFNHQDVVMLKNLKSNIQYAFTKAQILEEKSKLLSETQAQNSRILDQSREIRSQKENLESINSQLNKTLDEMKAMQLQLVQSEKMASLGTLVAGVAHEINNPVNFIHASVHPLKSDVDELKRTLTNVKDALNDYLKNGNGEDRNKLNLAIQLLENPELEEIGEEIESLLRGLETGSTRTTEIVKSLRSFSRRDSGGFRASDLHESLEATLMLCRSEARDKISIVRNFGSIPDVPCHTGQINQVFMNIIVNAFDAMLPQGGTLSISTGLKSNHVVIEFSDTGAGIGESDLKHIFDPFFTTKPVGKGTGLGLAISYGIISNHHGRIQVESKKGIGTTFSVWLPIIQPENSPVNDSSSD